MTLRRIDIITEATDLSFKTAYEKSHVLDMEGIKVRALFLDDLICSKKASGRTKDLADVEALESKLNSQLIRSCQRCANCAIGSQLIEGDKQEHP